MLSLSLQGAHRARPEADRHNEQGPGPPRLPLSDHLVAVRKALGRAPSVSRRSKSILRGPMSVFECLPQRTGLKRVNRSRGFPLLSGLLALYRRDQQLLGAQLLYKFCLQGSVAVFCVNQAAVRSAPRK